MKRLIAAGFGMAALLALAACGASTHSASSSTTSSAASNTTPAAPSKPEAAKNYLAIVTPANSAVAAFSKAANAWANSTTNKQAESAAEPLISALQTTDLKLLAATWPNAQTTADIHALVNADGAVIGDLLALSTVNLLNASTWESAFERDVTALSTAAGTARSDLGLPPNS